MEAALRTAAHALAPSEDDLPRLEFEEVRGMDGLRIADVALVPNGDPIKVGVVHGGASIIDLIDRIRAGNDPQLKDLKFVEVMMCKGGCVGGAGNPKPPPGVSQQDLVLKRVAALHALDASSSLRRSHESPLVKDLYDSILSSPGSPLAHRLLHTHYSDRSTSAKRAQAKRAHNNNTTKTTTTTTTE